MNKERVVPLERFTSVSEWYDFCKEAGYAVPVQACYQLQKRMKADNLSFTEAYAVCLADSTILEYPDRNVVYAARP